MREVGIVTYANFIDVLDDTERKLVAAKLSYVADMEKICIMRWTPAYWKRRQAEHRGEGHEPERGA